MSKLDGRGSRARNSSHSAVAAPSADSPIRVPAPQRLVGLCPNWTVAAGRGSRRRDAASSCGGSSVATKASLMRSFRASETGSSVGVVRLGRGRSLGRGHSARSGSFGSSTLLSESPASQSACMSRLSSLLGKSLGWRSCARRAFRMFRSRVELWRSERREAASENAPCPFPAPLFASSGRSRVASVRCPNWMIRCSRSCPTSIHNWQATSGSKLDSRCRVLRDALPHPHWTVVASHL